MNPAESQPREAWDDDAEHSAAGTPTGLLQHAFRYRLFSPR